MIRDMVVGMAFARRLLIPVALTIGLAACADTELSEHAGEGNRGAVGAGAEHYKVGQPYQIAGAWYYPKEDYEYVETGIASWYGPGFHGKKTANGAIFDENALTAAHRTLPLPSIVRVTNLENGRSMKLRVNDRGPFAKNRIIDVSKKAAELLGFQQKGTAKVRVEILSAESRRVAAMAMRGETDSAAVQAVPVEAVMVENLNHANPDGSLTRNAGSTASGMTQSAEARAPRDVVLAEETVQYPVTASDIFVQVGAFARKHNALRLQARLSELGPTRIREVQQGGATFFRVQLGPVASVGEADQMIARLDRSGFNDATITVE